ncbi:MULTISPECIES: L,D-transpeptidase [Streptomyces]|uniref:Ig-like domain-containing protein n=1 Tax=Streptomyces doudnae TaxID=3075536 RepID=A0ABD5ETQ1_9ACTN|nr:MULTISPECIES: Ig-like domain-containing protein [unclassified Streptomyces]MDT0438010.1 Ig-like domain-containing protein [Streptomyces sp. DSM 41981]MYQ62282.1 L,D-transpeptidase family protein [Streptomyces sp. SID4950]SCD34169.1 Lipoprotein-anchoring transpeptidase ErfK/SrfK [Streptomyces sp. SolWspMP-5a-2]
MTSPDIAARRALGACAALMVGALTLTACGGSANANSGKGDGKGGGSSKSSSATIAISAKDGSTSASINSTGVKVSGGKLTDVRMTVAGSGQAVAGEMSANGASWKPEEQLERGTKYQISATAKDAEGRTAAANSIFTTVTTANSFIGTYTPDAGTTVGVGMPVSFTFDKAISDRKDVQSHITVTSSGGQKVVGHWFGAQRLDFRPEEYWKAGSKVTMKIDLDGVEGADGVYGVQKKTVTFTVGRAQVSTVDVNTQTMTVVRDGSTLKSIPISSGSPQHTTYNGQMVISEKFRQTRMNSQTVGLGGEYDIPDVPDAMRLTTSGTFIHGNYWYNKGNPPFGREGTSHGCVGLADAQGAQGDTPAHWFFDNSLVGDVVIVKNSPDKTVSPDNGLNGWNMAWSEWVAGSAV